jgi:hypothetical protein
MRPELRFSRALEIQHNPETLQETLRGIEACKKTMGRLIRRSADLRVRKVAEGQFRPSSFFNAFGMFLAPTKASFPGHAVSLSQRTFSVPVQGVDIASSETGRHYL